MHMTIRQRFYLALSVAAVIIALHQIAINLYLYWIYRGVDIPMHIMGGFMAGLFVFIFLRVFKFKENRRNLLLGVLLVGVGWEILELVYRVDIVGFWYWLDTAKDLIDDVIGGLISIYIWKKIPN